MIPDRKVDLVRLTALGAVLIGLTTVLAFLGVALGGDRLASALDISSVGSWLWMLPVGACGLGIYNLLNVLANRQGAYKRMAGANVVRSVVTAVGQIAGSGLGPGGLILGHSVGQLGSGLPLLGSARSVAGWREIVSFRALKEIAVRYRRFPLLSLPSAMANTLSVQLVNVLVAAVYSASTLGFYSLVQRLLGLPTSVVGTAVGQVYFKAAADCRRRGLPAIRVYDRTVARLALIAIPTFGAAFAFSPWLFGVVFGEEWRIAGEYARYLIPFFAVRFVVSSVSMTTSVYERQHVALYWQLGLLGVGILSITAAHLLSWTVQDFLMVLSALSGTHYVLLFLIMRRIARG